MGACGESGPEKGDNPYLAGRGHWRDLKDSWCGWVLVSWVEPG